MIGLAMAAWIDARIGQNVRERREALAISTRTEATLIFMEVMTYEAGELGEQRFSAENLFDSPICYRHKCACFITAATKWIWL